MGAFLCKMVHYMQSVSFVCSVLTLTAMSIERYYAIVHPMRAKYICTISQARKIILGIWCASFLLAFPAIFVQIHLPVGLKVQAFWCVRDWEHEALWRLHELYMLVLILVVPTCIMAAAYTSICWEVWHVMQRRCDMTAGHSRHMGSCRRVESMPLRPSAAAGCGSCVVNSGGGGGGGGCVASGGGAALNGAGQHRESLRKISQVKAEQEAGTVKQVIKMLVAVVVLFVLCWGPLLVDNVLTAFRQLPSYRTDSLKHMATAFHLMAYFNSCINPIVYGFMSKNFRESFYKALCRCCYRGSAGLRLRPSSLSHTRSTSVRYTTDPSCGRRISVTTSAF
ncbi:pyroglutamylated RF-amide peptide receptor-like [Schistocerca piceifrons]|uniref:pyroglutamylated RF-amide peptide receptor-like n=1 Tax=Schistocerca piceifrons TaxID=274613 RepID=UPI001F5E5B02|nr:pyroglutamylated RF-amide peptide receptor-like [Schistocerca piceifrons]